MAEKKDPLPHDGSRNRTGRPSTIDDTKVMMSSARGGRRGELSHFVSLLLRPLGVERRLEREPGNFNC